MRKDLVPSNLSNLYASIIDQRRFTSLSSIMWDEFSMLGQFEINGLENFILAMQQLENYQKHHASSDEYPRRVGARFI